MMPVMDRDLSCLSGGYREQLRARGEKNEAGPDAVHLRLLESST